MLRVLRCGVLGAVLLAGCGDSTGPREPGAGESTLEIRGLVAIDLTGQAQLIPALAPGRIESINLLAQTDAFFYSLELEFSPTIAPQAGTLAIGPAAPVRATFFVFNRQSQTYEQIMVGKSGTLVLESCDMTRCIGSASLVAKLQNSEQVVTITGAFHAN